MKASILPRWKEIEPSLVTLLKDEIPEGSDRSRRYTTADLMTWWNHAQLRLATMKPRPRHAEYKGIGLKVALPDHFYKSALVITPDGKVFKRLDQIQWYCNSNTPGYIVYEGHLTLRGTKHDHFMLLYHAYYPPVEKEESFVHTPPWAVEACMLYAGALALTREVIADARYRKFISRQDAGQPQQIPFLPAAEFLIKRFEAIVRLHADDDEEFRSIDG